MFLYHLSTIDRLLLSKLRVWASHCQAPCLMHSLFHILSEVIRSLVDIRCVCLWGKEASLHHGILYMHPLWLVTLLVHTCLGYDLVHVHSLLTDVSLHTDSHTFAVAGNDLLSWFIMPRSDCSSFLSLLMLSLLVHAACMGLDLFHAWNNLTKKGECLCIWDGISLI